ARDRDLPGAARQGPSRRIGRESVGRDVADGVVGGRDALGGALTHQYGVVGAPIGRCDREVGELTDRVDVALQADPPCRDPVGVEIAQMVARGVAPAERTRENALVIVVLRETPRRRLGIQLDRRRREAERGRGACRGATARGATPFTRAATIAATAVRGTSLIRQRNRYECEEKDECGNRDDARREFLVDTHRDLLWGATAGERRIFLRDFSAIVIDAAASSPP